MKNNYFLKAMGIALCLVSFASPVLADETDNPASSDLTPDQMQTVNPAPDTNHSIPDSNVDANNQNNSAATPNNDDAHEDTANSGDDDY